MPQDQYQQTEFSRLQFILRYTFRQTQNYAGCSLLLKFQIARLLSPQVVHCIIHPLAYLELEAEPFTHQVLSIYHIFRPGFNAFIYLGQAFSLRLRVIGQKYQANKGKLQVFCNLNWL